MTVTVGSRALDKPYDASALISPAVAPAPAIAPATAAYFSTVFVRISVISSGAKPGYFSIKYAALAACRT